MRYFTLVAAYLTIASSIAQTALTLEDVCASRKFFPESVFGLNPMNEGEYYTSLDATNYGNAIVMYSYKTGQVKDTLMRSSQLPLDAEGKNRVIEGYSVSLDEKKILIAVDMEAIYRHSTKEFYYIYSQLDGKIQLLTDGEKQRYATFSPTADKVAYVKENNLFVKDLSSGREIQVTFDGKENEIINGATDWVYEEEFGFDQAFFWSPDGAYIAYYKFDEKRVKQFSMDIYGSLYPQQSRFKYPKAGEDNAIVGIEIFDVKQAVRKPVSIPVSYEYIPRIKWTADPGSLCITTLNRHQNDLNLIFANASTGAGQVILNEKSETYIDITDNLTFTPDKKHFIWSSEKDGFNHLYLYDTNGKLINQITQGTWDMTAFHGLDAKTGLIYYSSAEESPLRRSVYAIKMNGTGKKKLSTEIGHNTPVFNSDYSFFINYYSSADSPLIVTLHDQSGKRVRVLKDNEKLKQNLAQYPLSKKEFFTFKNTTGIELNAYMIKPWNFDASKKYPVYMFMYGGPGSQEVLDEWDLRDGMFHQYLASKGYLVVCVDNRGTGARGRDFKNCTYKQLGKLETEDQIDAAKYVRKLPYADAKRISMQGWSYGGYMSSLCITKGAEVFKTAIAVAPVTNWRFYDSIYTERYMQTPQENPLGYDDNSPINHVDKLKGKYLLIHGTADDNVHFQNSMEMAAALIKLNKPFDMMMYPDKNHSIRGGLTRLHLYTKIMEFVSVNL